MAVVMKTAMPPLFGGVFPKNRATIPSWRRRNRNLTTLVMRDVAFIIILFYYIFWLLKPPEIT